ncbi:hypothetical protein M0805_007617 [Coniferiporia weirii]|nr:hypothetical protein M0805_007617 [Coniferiporia weirii]
MPILKNHEVWIESDGERYAEYDVKVEGNVVTCYIASQADKTFQISWTNHDMPILTSTSASFRVDGVKLDSIVHRDTSGILLHSSKGHWTSGTSLMPYEFAHIALTDDDILSAPSKHMGTICVKVYRIVVVKRLDGFVTRTLPDGFQNPVSERAKKMGSHRVGLGDVKEVAKPRGSLKTTRYQNEVGPYVTFKFIYRPRDALQALEIIPAAQEIDKKPAAASQVLEPSETGARHNKRRRNCSTSVKTEDQVIDLSSSEDDEEQKLLKRRAEISRKLKELKKRRKSSNAKLKSETKEEDNPLDSSNMMELTYDDNGAIDLTLD